jgi:hypothetical protein
MNILLDILGSIVTGGMVLLIHFGLISKMNNVSTDLLLSNINASDAVEITKIIESDVYKIGYRDTTSIVFELAQQCSVQFKAAINVDSLPKSIFYYTGTTSQMTSTKNPNDKPLYRQIIGQNPVMIGIVRDFNLTYLDSAGNSIAYAYLTTQTQRNQIQGLTLLLKVESSATVLKDERSQTKNDVYPFVEWRKTIYPKNAP